MQHEKLQSAFVYEDGHLRYLCMWYDHFIQMGSVHSGKITWISFSVLFSLFSCLVRAQESLAWRLEQRAGISILHLALPPVVLRTTSDYQGGVIPHVESATYLSPAGSPDLPVLAYEVLLNDARGAELVASRAVDSEAQNSRRCIQTGRLYPSRACEIKFAFLCGRCLATDGLCVPV